MKKEKIVTVKHWYFALQHFSLFVCVLYK